MPTSSSRVMARFQASFLSILKCQSMPSMICLPMGMVGSRLVMGSWNTMEIRLPLMWRRIHFLSFCRMSTVSGEPSAW